MIEVAVIAPLLSGSPAMVKNSPVFRSVKAVLTVLSIAVVMLIVTFNFWPCSVVSTKILPLIETTVPSTPWPLLKPPGGLPGAPVVVAAGWDAVPVGWVVFGAVDVDVAGDEEQAASRTDTPAAAVRPNPPAAARKNRLFMEK